jgi:hypothetical protein
VLYQLSYVGGTNQSSPGLRKSSVGALAVEPRGNGASRVVWNAELEFADRAQEAQFLGMIEQGYAGALRRLTEVVEG